MFISGLRAYLDLTLSTVVHRNDIDPANSNNSNNFNDKDLQRTLQVIALFNVPARRKLNKHS